MHFILALPLQPFNHHIVAVLRHEDSSMLALVHELHERVVSGLLEQQVVVEAVGYHLVNSRLKVEQRLCKLDRILQILLILRNCTAELNYERFHLVDDQVVSLVVMREHLKEQFKLIVLSLLEEVSHA